MIKKLMLLELLCFAVVSAQSTEKSLSLAERLVSTLPELPSMIRGGITGDTGGFQKIISNVLGDGLISQLVNDPLQVAGEVLPELGTNISEINGVDSKEARALSKGLFGLLTTTNKPTTEAAMLVDGVPVDFDAFIRKHNLENQFSTKKPRPTTPPPPSAEKIADVVLNKLQSQMREKDRDTERTPKVQPMILPPFSPDPSSMYNMDYIQRYIQSQTGASMATNNGNLMSGSPPGFQQTSTQSPLSVVANASPTSYEEIKRLKEMLGTYEEMIQTKDFFAKRKQLQVLENQLEQHRNQIHEQQKLETTLREKERLLQEKKKEMEQELHAQLKSWNLTDIPEVSSTTTLTTPIPTTRTTPAALIPVLIQDPIQENHSVRDFNDEIVVLEDIPHEEIRRAPQHFEATEQYPVVHKQSYQSGFGSFSIKPSAIVRDAERLHSNCECKKLSMNMMKGDWIIAFVTENLLSTISEKVMTTLNSHEPETPTCSNLFISGSSPRNIRESRVSWEFRTEQSPKLNRISGYLYRDDDRTMRIQSSDALDDLFSRTVCALKTNEGNQYEYMLLSMVEDSCKEAMLLVRDPAQFFNEENRELTQYLKTRIDDGKLQKLQMAPFAHSCSE